jgi:anaerobic magnesium-protoporphyrin IX monomethyl ester cyclase
MRILFTHSYFLRFDAKQFKTAMPYPPLGTLYAAAYLRKHGYQVSLFDTMFAHTANDIKDTLDNYKPDVLVIYDDGFNYLTKMCLTNMRQAAFTIQQLAVAKGIKVITSSSDSTDHYGQYLQQGANYVIIGEAEETLLQLLNAIKSNAETNTITGISYLQNAKTVKTAARPVLTNLDELPMAAWDLVNIEPYKQMWLQNHGYFSLNISTTRGCPFKCNWCAKPIYGNRYNARSATQVVHEIKYLQQQFDNQHIWFSDDIFGLKPGWVQQFYNEVTNAGITIKYKIQSRADLLVQENYVKYLAFSGCHTVWMGAESGSQQILDAMDKGTTINQIKTATHLLRQYNIRPAFFLQFGYPGEQKADINKTLELVKELLPAEIGVSVSYPLPGTKFYENVKHHLTSKANWTDSDELALMFKNTYSPQYYKQLQRYIHKFHQRYLSLQSLLKLKGITSILKGIYYWPASIIDKLKLSLIKN